ncbi:hypothetical protein [Treponema phagedenis]|uniref:hypothetical protein n=1 Tax=Treponema phagedenis TaxID=162 RepID=UPI0004677099|nr:hypothetical protein [Treponema phagedenis]
MAKTKSGVLKLPVIKRARHGATAGKLTIGKLIRMGLRLVLACKHTEGCVPDFFYYRNLPCALKLIINNCIQKLLSQ